MILKAKKYLLSIAMAAFLLTASGCWWYSFTGAEIDPNIETISIEYFPNNAPLINPMLSQLMTETIRDMFISQTSLKLVDKNGDLRISGQIIDYSTVPTAIQANQTAGLNRLTIKIKVKFVNTFNDEKSYETTFSRYEEYPSNKDLNTLDAEIKKITDALAQDVFNKAVVNW